MAEKGSYETFDSGDGPTQKGQEGATAHNDANPSDQGVVQGAVPEVPQK